MSGKQSISINSTIEDLVASIPLASNIDGDSLTITLALKAVGVGGGTTTDTILSSIQWVEIN